jgi:transposase
VETCKLHCVDPQAWLADGLARLPDHPAKRIGDLLPWAWQAERLATDIAARRHDSRTMHVTSPPIPSVGA